MLISDINTDTTLERDARAFVQTSAQAAAVLPLAITGVGRIIFINWEHRIHLPSRKVAVCIVGPPGSGSGQ